MFDKALATDALSRLRGTVDDLLACSVSGASDEFVLDLLRVLQTQVNRLAAVDAVVVAEIEARRLFFDRGCANTANLLAQLLRIEPGQARARVAAAAELGPRRFPSALAQLARRVSDTLDPDGTLADESDRQRRRHLDVHRRPDGSAAVRGELDAICTEALLTVLDPLARPGPAAAGAKDPRTPGQRRHDGLRDGLLAAIRSGQLPDSGGITTTILLTTTVDDLRADRGLARTGHGALIPTRTVTRDLLPDAQLMPIGLSRTQRTARRLESYGPARRFFTAGQRLALAARDGGCSFPGCTVPASWCQAHHVIAWKDGGPTTIDNGTLLCGFHHREHAGLGWTCEMRYGAPRWRPPPWVDPERRPVQNTVQTLAT